MKKEEAKGQIRALALEWAALNNVKRGNASASFDEFKRWVRTNGRGACLDFRAVPDADYVAEMWFDDVMGLNWTR